MISCGFLRNTPVALLSMMKYVTSKSMLFQHNYFTFKKVHLCTKALFLQTLKSLKNRRGCSLYYYGGMQVCGAFVYVKLESDKETLKYSKLRSEMLQLADNLYKDEHFTQLYTTLRKAVEGGEPAYQHAEIFWRLARAAKEMADLHDKDPQIKKDYTFEALAYAEKGIETDPEHWACNKWYGILLDLSARFEGTKKRIQNSYLVKEYLLKAVKSNPADATTIHSLGVWCFEFADLPWYQKKIASALFATPPASTYNEALEYLLLAEKVEPNFYSYNLLYLGKCYERLNDHDLARMYLSQCVNYSGSSFDDIKAKEEAAVLLKKLKV